MNKHFEDARYYLKRAGEHAKAGVAEELGPVEERVRGLTGREEEAVPGRVDRIRDELEEFEERAEGEAREKVAAAREKLAEYREERQAAA